MKKNRMRLRVDMRGLGLEASVDAVASGSADIR